MISPSNLHKVLNSSHFHAIGGESAVMNAEVVMIILPETVNQQLSKPVNITFQHLQVSGPSDMSVCVFWREGAWSTDGCFASRADSNQSVCTCDHLSTFALIMQTRPTLQSDDDHHSIMESLNTFFVVVGLVFLTLAVLTFALCRFNPRVSNVARLNLSISLLLAHFLFLVTQMAQPQKTLCKILAGLLHFLFLCSFMWMSAEAVLLFLSVRKLRQIKAKDRTGLHWRYQLLVGYGIPLVIVIVAAAVMPDGHGSQECWLETRNGFNWSFLGPACFILTGNIIFFVIIFVTIYTTLRKARSEVSKVKYTRLLLFKILGQCVILGCPWMLLMVPGSKVVEFISVFLVSQQGTVIFLIHCLLNHEVRKQYAAWWQKCGSSNKRSDSNVGLSTVSPQSSGTNTRHTGLAPGQQTEDATSVVENSSENQKSE